MVKKYPCFLIFLGCFLTKISVGLSVDISVESDYNPYESGEYDSDIHSQLEYTVADPIQAKSALKRNARSLLTDSGPIYSNSGDVVGHYAISEDSDSSVIHAKNEDDVRGPVHPLHPRQAKSALKRNARSLLTDSGPIYSNSGDVVGHYAISEDSDSSVIHAKNGDDVRGPVDRPPFRTKKVAVQPPGDLKRKVISALQHGNDRAKTDTRKRNTYNYNQDELTFKDIERFLDPVTSPSATKGELKKILEQMFALKQIRKKRSPNEKSLTIDEVDKWLDQVTSPSASKTQIRSMLDSVFHSNLLRSSNSRRSTGIQDEVPKKRAIRRAQLTLEQVMPHLNSVTSSSVSKGDLIQMLGGAFDSPYENKVMKRSFRNPLELILSGFKAIFSLLQIIFNGVTTGLVSIFDNIMRILNHILSVLGLQSVTTVAPINEDNMYIDYDYSYDDYGKRRKRSLNELPNIINLVKKLSENAKGNYPQLNLDWTSVLFKVTEHLPELREKFNELLKLVSDFMLAEKPETKGNT